MRGYVSFVLVFISSLILLSSLALLNAARSADLSGAVEAARAGGISMNVRECVVESVRQGASSGFLMYDASHDITLCRHCMDNSCVPPNPAYPNPVNWCDATLCGQCFRSSEARSAAETGAGAALLALRPDSFDDEYSVEIGGADFEANLMAAPQSRNGIHLESMLLRNDVVFTLESAERGFRGESVMGSGMVVRIGNAID